MWGVCDLDAKCVLVDGMRGSAASDAKFDHADNV